MTGSRGVIADPTERQRFLRRTIWFVTIGSALYAALYVGAELLVDRYAQRNRFRVVHAAPHTHYDHVILGASHAAVFDYRDMNARLEQMTGARILNLAVDGGGIAVGRLLLEYFLAARRTDSVVYVVDSFAFYSRQWNEDRLRDKGLFHRAPFDFTLARLLLRHPATRLVGLDYVSGFSKINNPSRFTPDLFANEGDRFDRVYRPVAQLDRQRLEYLYPHPTDDATLRDSPYLNDFDSLVRDTRASGARFVVIRPPLPERTYRMIPNEAEFGAFLEVLLDRHGAELYDFSRVNDDPNLFFDSDHLNRTGVLRFFEDYLVDVLRVRRSPGRAG